MFPFPKVNNRRLPSTNKEKETKGRVSAIEDIIDLIYHIIYTIYSIKLYFEKNEKFFHKKTLFYL